MKIMNLNAMWRGGAALWIVVLIAIAISLATPLRAEPSKAVSGTYVVWVSQSGSGVPYLPNKDCVRFPGDGTMHLDSCLFSGPGEILSNEGGRWTGRTPCTDGLTQMFWIGSSFNGSVFGPEGVDTISAVGIRLDLPWDTTAFQGFRDDSCSIFLP